MLELRRFPQKSPWEVVGRRTTPSRVTGGRWSGGVLIANQWGGVDEGVHHRLFLGAEGTAVHLPAGGLLVVPVSAVVSLLH
jgi:hypothetical protein